MLQDRKLACYIGFSLPALGCLASKAPAESCMKREETLQYEVEQGLERSCMIVIAELMLCTGKQGGASSGAGLFGAGCAVE